jgi:hypothetical protein
MSEQDPIKQAQSGIALVGEIIKAAGDSPNAKAAANNLGQTAVTLTKTINNVLLRLAAVNFAFDKARTYFNGKFQQDLSEKTSKIPEGDVVEPKASIAGPTLQGLAFTQEEASLKEMYLNLLATSMDGRIANNAHPAFVEIIKQLDADDADLMRGALRSPAAIPIAQIRFTKVGEQGHHVIATHLLNLRGGPDTTTPIENPQLPALIDNWTRLGLVEVDYNQHLLGQDLYQWVEQRPEFIRIKQARETDKNKITFQKGILTRTQLGVRFASAVGLL